jgi:hypothetical protein
MKESGMAQMAPPQQPPLVAVDDGDGRSRLRFRLWQLWWTVLTILVTVWFMTLGPVPAILALVTAKHVLVALLIIGLDTNAGHQAEA